MEDLRLLSAPNNILEKTFFPFFKFFYHNILSVSQNDFSDNLQEIIFENICIMHDINLLCYGFFWDLFIITISPAKFPRYLTKYSSLFTNLSY